MQDGCDLDDDFGESGDDILDSLCGWLGLKHQLTN